MSTSGPNPGDPYGDGTRASPSEEELRAAYEAEIKQIRVEQIVLEQVVTLVNLGMRRTGLSPGTEDERDLDQVRLAIESVRALLPIVELVAGPQAGQIRDALSQLQMAFVRLGGSPAGTAGPETGPAGPATPGAAGAPGAGSPAPAVDSDRPPAPGAGTVPPPPPDSPGAGEPAPDTPDGPGPAQRSGRLWVPGQ